MRKSAAWSIVVVIAGLAGYWATAPARAQDATLTGPDLSVWQGKTGDWLVAGDTRPDPRNAARLLPIDGAGAILNGTKGRTVNLLSKLEHGDVEAHIEFMVPKGSNSGVYFQGRYEIQILDSWGEKDLKHGDCGGIYQRWDPKRGKGNEGFDGHPPRVNAAKPPGEWQSFDVVFRAPRFDAAGKKTADARFVKVVHNGVVIHENVAVSGPTRAAAFATEAPTGPLMLQGDHGPVAYRKLTLRPLGGTPR